MLQVQSQFGGGIGFIQINYADRWRIVAGLQDAVDGGIARLQSQRIQFAFLMEDQVQWVAVVIQIFVEQNISEDTAPAGKHIGNVTIINVDEFFRLEERRGGLAGLRSGNGFPERGIRQGQLAVGN